MEEILQKTSTYLRSSFCNIFYNWESSHGLQEKLWQLTCCAGLLYGKTYATIHLDCWWWCNHWRHFYITPVTTQQWAT